MIGGIIKYEELHEVIKPRHTPLNNYYYHSNTTTTHGLVGPQVQADISWPCHGEENVTIKRGVIVIGSSPTTINQ